VYSEGYRARLVVCAGSLRPSENNLIYTTYYILYTLINKRYAKQQHYGDTLEIIRAGSTVRRANQAGRDIRLNCPGKWGHP
jgi:hypothetical protein